MSPFEQLREISQELEGSFAADLIAWAADMLERAADVIDLEDPPQPTKN